MVYWGPWQQGLLARQRFRAESEPLNGTYDGYRVRWEYQRIPGGDFIPSPEGFATPFSGWFMDDEFPEHGYRADGAAGAQHPNPINDPPNYDLSIRQFALDGARNNPATDDAAPSLYFAGFNSGQSMNYFGPASGWREGHDFAFMGRISTLRFGITNPTLGGAGAGTPASTAWPAGADYVMTEEPDHPNRLMRVEDASISQWSFGGGAYADDPLSPYSGMWIAAVRTHPDDFWFGEAGMNLIRMNNVTAAPAILSPTDLNALVDEDAVMGPSNWIDKTDDRWPQLAVTVTEENIGTPSIICNAPWGPTIELVFRLPRYRFGYDEPITTPYRRITQRGDGLAGGARRIHPRPKSIQGSARRGAGSIV